MSAPSPQQQQQPQPTVFQPQQPQPTVFQPQQLQPGQAPPAYVQQQSPPQQQAVNPGAVMYYPQAAQQPGAPQMVVGAQVIQYETPHYDYTPSSFRLFSLLTILVCGLFSPLSLVFSIPALLFSNKSENSAKLGATKLAKQQGVCAAYLNIMAILFATLLATILTGLILGLYGQPWALQRCIEKVEDDYGGEIPFTPGTDSLYYYRGLSFNC